MNKLLFFSSTKASKKQFHFLNTFGCFDPEKWFKDFGVVNKRVLPFNTITHHVIAPKSLITAHLKDTFSVNCLFADTGNY